MSDLPAQARNGVAVSDPRVPRPCVFEVCRARPGRRNLARVPGGGSHSRMRGIADGTRLPPAGSGTTRAPLRDPVRALGPHSSRVLRHPFHGPSRPARVTSGRIMNTRAPYPSCAASLSNVSSVRCGPRNASNSRTPFAPACRSASTACRTNRSASSRTSATAALWQPAAGAGAGDAPPICWATACARASSSAPARTSACRAVAAASHRLRARQAACRCAGLQYRRLRPAWCGSGTPHQPHPTSPICAQYA